eukprot:2878638-Rhodomonas_salina.1
MYLRVTKRFPFILVLLHEITTDSLGHARPISGFASPFEFQGSFALANPFATRSATAGPSQSAAIPRRRILVSGHNYSRLLWGVPFRCKSTSDAGPMDDNRPATGKYAKPGFKRRRALDDGSPARRAQVSDTADRPRSKKRAAKDAIDPRRNQFRVHAIEEQPVVVHDGPERPGFERRMTKDEINRLPLKKNEQAIIFVQSEDQLSQALAYLKNERILGFDTETKPAFTKGERYLPSLVQLSGKEKTIIIQVAKVGFPMELRELLSNASIIKAGVGVDGDIRELQE